MFNKGNKVLIFRNGETSGIEYEVVEVQFQSVKVKSPKNGAEWYVLSHLCRIRSSEDSHEWKDGYEAGYLQGSKDKKSA